MEDADPEKGGITWPEAPTAASVARRSLVLAAVVCRASIDDGAGDSDVEALHGRILGWLTRLNLWDEAEPGEEAMLRTPLGLLESKDVIQAGWYVEGLAVLAWALKYLEFPKHGAQVDSYVVTDAIWFLNEIAEDVITDAELRSPAELEACRELLYAIHSRLRDYVRNKAQRDFTKWVEQEWLASLNLNAAELIVHNDLAIGGKAISEASEKRLQEVMSITLERHRAIIWLIEGHISYPQTPVDT